MTKNLKNKSDSETLRLKAEARLIAKQSKQVVPISDGNMLKLIHELQVHQVELEMQNEELILAKELAETATEKFTTLYDFAPTGYYTLSKEGSIIELNLTGAKMLGKERCHLKNKQLGIFIAVDDRPVFNHFLNNIFDYQTQQNCEIRLTGDEKISTYVYFTGIVTQNNEYCLLTGVDITERKKAEEELQENNARLNLAMQAANMAWWEMDISTGSVTFGDKKAEMLGFPPGNFTHYSDFTKLIHPDDHDKAMNAMYAHIHGSKEKYEVEYRIQTKSGEYKWFYDIGSIVKRSTGGVPLKVTGLVLDISERRYAEEALKVNEVSFRFLFANNPLPMWVYDMETLRFLEVNETAVSRYGYSHDEFLQMRLTDIRPEEDISRLLEDIKRDRPVLQDSGQWRHRLKDGRIIDVEITSHTLVFANRKAVLVLAKDITERKQAEIALQKSEERYRLVLQNSMDAILFTEPGGTIFSANPAACEMFQRTEEEICKIGRNGLADTTDPRLTILLDERNRSGKANGEITMIRKDGSKFPVDISTSLFLDENDEQKTSMIIRDITKRRVAEIALQKSEETYRTLFENSGTGVVIINRDGKFLMVNEKSATQFGCAPIEIIGKSLFDFLPQQTAQKYLEFNNSLLDKGGHREYEDTFVLNGKQKAFFIIDQCMKDENGNNVAIQSSSIDITDRKNSEEQLKKIQQLLAETEIIGKVGGWEFNIDTMKQTWTDEVYNLHEVDFNYDPNVDEGINFYTPESRPIIVQAVQRVMELGEPFDLELEIITAKGNLRKVHSIGKADFKQRRVYGFFQDITDRKLKEEELAFQARLLSEVNDAVFSSDRNFRINYWNHAAEKMFGWTTEEAVGNISGELLKPKTDVSTLEEVRSKLQNEGYWEGEGQYMRRDGTYFFVEVNSKTMKDAEGKYSGQIVVVRDITDRKLAEETIKRSETILKLFIEHSPAAIAMFDLDMKYIATSNRYLIDYDLGGQNLIGRSHYEIFPEIPERWKVIHNRCLSGATEHCEEDPFLRISGKLDWIRWEICPWHEADGIIGGIILFSEVITENIIAKQSLQKSEEIWQKLVATSPEFIAILDIEGNYQYLNHYAEGFSEKDISGKKAADFLAEKSKAEFLSRFETCRQTQQTQQFEFDALGDKGIIRTYEGYLVPILEQEKVASIMSIANDISERKKTEEKLSASEVRYRRLFESAKDGILILDAETGIIVDVNPFLIAMLNYSHDVFLGKKIWEIGSFKDVIKNKANFLELQLKEYIRYEDLPLETAAGHTIHVEFVSNVYQVNNMKVIQCNIRDISERKIAERQIRKSREQLAQLYKHLKEVREEERTSIAREIHDDLGQSLAGLKIDLLGIKEDIIDKVCQIPKINKAISLVETTIKSAQKLTSQLRPQMLDELGLASAIEWQSNEFKIRTGIKCTLELEEIDDISENTAISLFRIFQASLTNIMLHSQAKSISVKLELKEDIVYLSVADNGIGITPEQLSSSKSYGIIGMRERANQINAKFEINTQPGKGTKITVSVSIK